jgi:signal transduction histidine kinase
MWRSRTKVSGFRPEHLPHIFERFYQVDGSTTRRFGGMGIGLALVWEIMEAHRGSRSGGKRGGKGEHIYSLVPLGPGGEE